MSEITIIGEKEKSLRVKIEATDWVDSPFYVPKEIKHGRPSLRVFNRAKITSWFIEK
jgi:hypothetical protein